MEDNIFKLKKLEVYRNVIGIEMIDEFGAKAFRRREIRWRWWEIVDDLCEGDE